MENKDKALQLIEQMLEMAGKEDELHKIEALKIHKAQGAIGESWLIFYLKNLRGLIENIHE